MIFSQTRHVSHLPLNSICEQTSEWNSRIHKKCDWKSCSCITLYVCQLFFFFLTFRAVFSFSYPPQIPRYSLNRRSFLIFQRKMEKPWLISSSRPSHWRCREWIASHQTLGAPAIISPNLSTPFFFLLLFFFSLFFILHLLEISIANHNKVTVCFNRFNIWLA